MIVGAAVGSTRICPGASPGFDRRFQLFFGLPFFFLDIASSTYQDGSKIHFELLVKSITDLLLIYHILQLAGLGVCQEAL